MTNFPEQKKIVKLSNGKEVILYDLSIGFIIDVEKKIVEDDAISIMKDASSLDEEEIRKLRKSEIEYCINEIMTLSYGEDKDSSEDSGETKKR